MSYLFKPNPGPQTTFMTHPARTVGYGGAAGGGKGLSLSTPLPTPDGFVLMGDVKVGDTLFDEAGRPCRVTAVSEVSHRDCFEVIFDDGTVIVADDVHRWLTYDAKDLARLTRQTPEWRARRRARRPIRVSGRKSAKFSASLVARNAKRAVLRAPEATGSVRNTREIFETMRTKSGRANHAIPVARPIDLPERELPLDPYLLGIWLGDGSTAAAHVTTKDPEVTQAFVDAGFEHGRTGANGGITHSFIGLHPVLRGLGVLGWKHVPQGYMRASRRQRLALLQGLMDSDGTCDPRGQCDFDNTNRDLADAVMDLVASLGWKASMVTKRAMLRGKDCGPTFRVSFAPDEPVFRLLRKACRQSLVRRRTTKFRYIVNVRPVASMPTKCISVDSPSRLYLATSAMVPTHNTEGLLFQHVYLLDFENQRVARGEISRSKAYVGFFRRVMPNLRQSIDRVLRTFPLIDPAAGSKGWHTGDNTYTFSCGLKFMFGHMEKPADFLKYYGFEFTQLRFDELTEFEEEQYDQLGTRLRSPDAAHGRFMNIRWGTNPVGPGLEWVRRRFVEIAPPGTTVRVPVKLGDGRTIYQDQVFIQSFLKDNPYLHNDGRYEAALRKNKPHIVKALMEGNWYVNTGALLADFFDPAIHVCENHKIPPNVFRFRSGDFGIHHNTSITWWYVDNDGCMTAYHNLYVKGLTAPQIAARVREIERYYGDWDYENNRSLLNGPLDAQCFKRSGNSGPTIAGDFWESGVMWRKSSKDRPNGIAEVCKRLQGRVVTAKDDKGNPTAQKPMIRWMKRCEAPIKKLPLIPADPLTGDDVKNNVEDDVLDDTIFACMSKPLKGGALDSPSAYDDDDDEDDVKARLARKQARITSLGWS